MKIDRQNTNQAVLAELGERLTRTRLKRNWTQQELARAAGVSKRTVERIEAGESNQLFSFIRLLRALDLMEQFNAVLPDELPSPIEQLKQRRKQRQRASSRKKSTKKVPRNFSWGDGK